MLDKVDLEKAGEDAAVWEKVVHKLRTRAMPPAGKPRPDASSYNFLITHLETELDRASAAKPNPGRPAIHRLNRAEYTNAIRDLLAVDIDGLAGEVHVRCARDRSYGRGRAGDPSIFRDI